MKPCKTMAAVAPAASGRYDEYARTGIDRRTFMAGLGGLALGGLTIGAASNNLLPENEHTQAASPAINMIKTSYLEFYSYGHGKAGGYMVQPAQDTHTVPAVLVVHENGGLNPYIKQVARQLARQGYLVFAPDALHTLGGSAGNDSQGRVMQHAMSRTRIEQDFIAAAEWLKAHKSSNGKLGVVGFCFGGYIGNVLATLPGLVDATVAFYGMPARGDLVDKVTGPLMIQFAGSDHWINDSWPGYEAALKTNRADYQVFSYPGAGHGFHNDSDGNYERAAAELAWSRTLGFFAEHLVG